MALCDVVFVVLYSCVISFSTCGNKEEFEAFVMFEFQILKGSELLLVTEPCSFIRKITSIFSDMYSFNIDLLPVLGLGLFQILFQMHSFFLIIILFFWPRLNLIFLFFCRVEVENILVNILRL